MFAMKDTFRWICAGCLTLCFAVPAFAQNQQFQDRANKAPMNGHTYAKQQAEKMQAAFKELAVCISANDNTDDANAWDPDKTALCVPKLIAFKQSLIDLDNGPPLVFGNSAEEERLRRESGIINSFVTPLANLYGSHVEVKDYRPALYKDMKWFRALKKWEKSKVGDYIDQLSAVDNLMYKYLETKRKGSVKDGRYVASSSVMKELDSIRAKLAKYFTYDVDNYAFSPRGEGLFLENLDRYNVYFEKNVGLAISRLENAQERVKKEVQELKVCVGIADQIGKDSVFYNLSRLPAVMLNQYVGWLDRDFEYMFKAWKEMKDGATPMGKLLTRKALDDTIFDTKDSYKRAVRASCYTLLLNTQDEKGNQLKHHIR